MQTWVYYSFQLAYESQLTVDLLATPDFAFYIDKTPPTLDSFLIKGQIVSDLRSLKVMPLFLSIRNLSLLNLRF